MSSENFESLWRGLLLRVPLAPVPLLQSAINTAYRRAVRSLIRWNALRSVGEFIIPAPYATGTITLTNGLATVSGVGTTWASAMSGWQLVINGRGPFYTFTQTGATTGTLDRVWADSTQTVAYSLQLIYVTPAADFDNFEDVRDLDNSFRLYLGWTQPDLDRVDPQRSASGVSWAIAPAPWATNSTAPKYELWPRPTGPKSYTYFYQRALTGLSATSDIPILPIGGDILREGALAELALWPGTTAERNPYFNPALNAAHEQRFQAGVAAAAVSNQELGLTDITPADSMTVLPLAADFLQNHVLLTP